MKGLLNDRKEIYGDYLGGSWLRADIMNLIRDRYNNIHKKQLPLLYDVFIFDIVGKLSRIAVTPNHKDSWTDVAGYATRVVESLQKGEDNVDQQ